MIRRGPKFEVITYACVGIALTGVCLKLAARYLPERQPNRLALEYGTYVKASSRDHVDWYPFTEEPFQLAARKGKLVLLDIGDMYSRPGTMFREDYLHQPELYTLINGQYVAIKVDELEMPWIRETIDLNSRAYDRSSGQLLLVLSSDGRIISESALRPLGSTPEQPGTVDWLAGFARQRFSNKRALDDAMSHSLQARTTAASAVVSDLELDSLTTEAMFGKCIRFVESGTVLGEPQVISGLTVDELMAGGQTDIGASLLLRMRESSCYDQVGAGFFTSSNVAGLRRPSYGKIVGQNALLCASLARASIAADAPLFSQTALDIAEWLNSEMVSKSGPLYVTGTATDESTSNGSHHYEWLDAQLSVEDGDILSIETVETGGPLRLQRSASFAEGAGITRTRRLSEIRKRLSRVERRGKLPQIDEASYADQNGMAISGLVVAGNLLNNPSLVSAAIRSFGELTRRFVQPIGDVLHAPSGIGMVTGYSGDYVWVARAAIDVYSVTGDPLALEIAQRVTDRMLELFLDKNGAITSCLSSQVSLLGSTIRCYPIDDSYAESTNALAARDLHDLAVVCSEARYERAAGRVLDAFAAYESQLDVPSAGYVGAAMHSFAPSILAKDGVPGELNEIQRDYPYLFCAPLSGPASEGLYVMSKGRIIGGPLSRSGLASLMQRLGYRVAKQRRAQ